MRVCLEDIFITTTTNSFRRPPMQKVLHWYVHWSSRSLWFYCGGICCKRICCIWQD